MLEKNLYALSHAQISHKLKNSMEYNPIDESILNIMKKKYTLDNCSIKKQNGELF